MGPFFRKLVTKLRKQGSKAYKINFNGGDEWYSRGIESIAFTGRESDWPEFLRQFIASNSINSICVYGDCRRYHKAAKQVADEIGIGFYAFEEGYIRPNHLTFERNGVNGYSEIAIDGLSDWQDKEIEAENVMGGTLPNRVRYCILYYHFTYYKRSKYPHYKHHRSLSRYFEVTRWTRALTRHYWYRLTEFSVQRNLIKQFSKHYFLVPLQVYNDAQIKFHSPYSNMEEFIAELMTSFSANASPEDILVFKHHPMDRGHSHYGDFIAQLSAKLELEGRIQYCHDQHLPTLLDHAKGVVTINSTTALSAFYHKASVKVMGDAFYDIEGLCSQQILAEFWQQPEVIDFQLFLRLRNFLAHHGQVNGSYYRKHAQSVDAVIAEMNQNGISGDGNVEKLS